MWMGQSRLLNYELENSLTLHTAEIQIFKHLENCCDYPKIWTVSFYPTLIYEIQHGKTNKMTCAPDKDSDQPGHSVQSDQSLHCALIGC